MKSEPVSLNSFDLDSADTAEMEIIIHGKPTGWIWTFAGPAHEKSVKYSEGLAREMLIRERNLEQQLRNGRKVKLPEESVDDIRKRSVEAVLNRLLGWNEINLDGKAVPFSEEAARALLNDRRKQVLLQQALDFLSAEESFTARSGAT